MGTIYYRDPYDVARDLRLSANNAGRTTRTLKIVKKMHRVSNFPMLAVPLCDKKERLPKLTMVVSALNNTARDVLVANSPWLSLTSVRKRCIR